MTNRTLVIAEAGVNHNGSIDTAIKMVDVAKNSGSDLIKFQTFKAENLVTRKAEKADYQKSTTGGVESQFEMLKKLELTPHMHEVLIEYCLSTGIGFISTPFDIESARYLDQFDLEYVKVPSGEITNLPYLEFVASLGRDVIMSTGMADLKEVEKAIEILTRMGLDRERLRVLHCNTEYPSPYADINLRAMLTIRDRLDVAVGYSDHSVGIEVPIAAVAMGARVIEKHFTLDRSDVGPDHQASLEPEELNAMVASIRNIESALGDGEKRVSSSERKNIPIARKSIVTSRAVREGEEFSADNLTVKRPGTGISPMCWYEVLGRRSSRDYDADELLDDEI